MRRIIALAGFHTPYGVTVFATYQFTGASGAGLPVSIRLMA